MTKPDKDRATEMANLLDQLRQVSAALWNAPGGAASELFAKLLEEREAIISRLPKNAALNADEKRKLAAILAADRYQMQQIENESAFVQNRLRAIHLRRRAARGYGTQRSTALNRTA